MKYRQKPITIKYIKKKKEKTKNPGNQNLCHSRFPAGIICCPHRGSFAVRDHFRSNLGITSGRGSFAALYRSAKRLRRKLEWRTTKNDLHNRFFVDQCRVVNDLVSNAKEIYFFSVIEDNHGNQRVLFQAIISLLHKKADLPYPSTCSDSTLADQFNSFSNNKIRHIREG